MHKGRFSLSNFFSENVSKNLKSTVKHAKKSQILKKLTFKSH